MTWDEFINYQIFELGDFKLLMGNLLLAILVVLLTFLFLILLRRIIFKPRFIISKIDEKRRATFYFLTKYIVWLISSVIILEVIGIKLSVLLFGSTALLVGLGLGLQNIFKDFVSGLFLLFEGSIKVGDIIEVDGEVGRVAEINLRSSEIFTRDDVTIIVPNSRFITEKVINWSHEKSQSRFNVTVNVAYGSNLDVVLHCLQEAMDEHPQVQNRPKPFVRFIDFGESALVFDMIFWSRNMFRIENIKSDLRFSVYKKLQENNVIIPFPQRDVHIKVDDLNKLSGKS